MLSSPFNENFNTLAPDDGLYTLEVDGKNETLRRSNMYELPLSNLKLKLSMRISSGANVSITYKQYWTIIFCNKFNQIN